MRAEPQVVASDPPTVAMSLLAPGLPVDPATAPILIPARRHAGSGRESLRAGTFLGAAALVSAAAGLAMWVVAGRLLPAAQLGVASSFLSAAMFIAGLSEVGAGPSTLKWIARHPADARPILARVYGTIVVAALVLGGLFWVTPLAENYERSGLTAILFITGCALWAIFAYQDNVLTSLGQAAVAPFENLLQALLRITLVVLLAPALGAIGVELGWYVATAAGVLVVSVVVARRLVRGCAVPPPAEPVAPLTPRVVISDLASASSATLSLTVLYNFVPVLVTYLAGPARGGIFFLLWAGFSVSDYASTAFANPIIVSVAAGTARAREMAKRVVRRLLALYAPAAIGVALLAGPLLGLLGAEYAEQGAEPLRVLASAALLRIIVPVTVAAAMGLDRRRAVASVHGVGVAAFLVAAVVSAPYGLMALAVSLLIVQSVQTFVCLVFLVVVTREEAIR